MRTEEPILTISVAADLLGLHPRTLMLYEKEGLMTPHRTGTNRRMFSIKNLEELQFIKFLTHDRGINLEGVKIVLKSLEITKGQIDLKKLLFPTFELKQLV